MNSTPAIYEAGMLAMKVCVVAGAAGFLVAAISQSDRLLVFFMALLCIPWPILALSDLFGPVIAWAFVFGFLHLAVLIAILVKLSESHTSFHVNMPPGQAGPARYRGRG